MLHYVRRWTLRPVHSGELDASFLHKPRNHNWLSVHETGMRQLHSLAIENGKEAKLFTRSHGWKKESCTRNQAQTYTICGYWIWNYSTQMETPWHKMGKRHISQQRKIKLLHRCVSTTQSRLNSPGGRHAKSVFTGKVITTQGNKSLWDLTEKTTWRTQILRNAIME